ncbi:uncharacterized protein ARMOST_06096 [Armillaria ostoyae]|uniref:Uncharacterized protein n=1 Tax=Armillaria ostoyae TaxID=47428 RepID=A0A284R224_ARMOS|nr:uncharacterized protein ARMOST_06096 [Armillaria ostoyae]
MEFVPISIDVIGPLSIRDFILVEHLKGIHSRIQRTHSYNDLDTLGMISKEDPVQCEADERALEVCVDFSDGGVDVGGGIRRDENKASAPPASLILSERTSHENDQVAFFWKQARRLQTTDMETRVSERRSRSSPKFQERSPSGLRCNPAYHSGYENAGNYRQANYTFVTKNRKLSGEKGQYQSLMLSHVAAERLKPDLRSEGRIFATFTGQKKQQVEATR